VTTQQNSGMETAISTPSTLFLLKTKIAEHLADNSLVIDADVLGNGGLVGPADYAQGTRQGGLLVVRLAPMAVYLAFFQAKTNQPETNQAFAQPPCPECLERRLRSVLTTPEQKSLQQGHEFQTKGSPYLLDTLADNIGILARSVVSRAQPAAKGVREVFSVHLVSQQIVATEFMADSFCATCSTSHSALPDAARLELRTDLKAKSGKGRMKSLSDYDLPMRAMVNPICGAAGAHAIRGYAQSITAPIFGQYMQRAHNGAPWNVSWSGLCTRTLDSRIAGVLESLERQAGMFAPPQRVAAFDSFANLSPQALDPSLCLAYSDECFTLPLGLTRYRHDLPLDWVWGFSLTSQQPILVPKQLVYYDRNPAGKATIVDNCSSGCALGSCYEEAILKALFELLERDSFVIAWNRKLALPRIDPATMTDRKARLILDRVHYLGYDLFLLDGRLDLELPSVIAIGRRRDREIGSLVVGASASTDCEEAVRGALLEAATSIVEVPAMIKANEKHVRELAGNFSLVKTVSDHAHLYGLPEMADKIEWLYQNAAVRGMDEAFPRNGKWHSEGNISADLDRCLAELARRGMNEVVVIDMTTREQLLLDLKTVRVIVPGLAPIDFGFPRNRAAGLPRLFSAPLAAGLKPFDNDEGLNPLPHPFP